jgi:glycosyltransferase involved in cell wall biosynthesis
LNEAYAATVCRIEPENNVHIILDAFSRQTAIPLVMVGNWKNSSYGTGLLEEYGRCPHIHLLDPIYEPGRINFLRSRAVMYVHGHSAGGTNPSLVEAMYLGLPVFAFDCIYNRYTTENHCRYWTTAGELFASVSQCGISDLESIGRTMKLVAQRRYRWNDIVSKYEGLFKNVS